MLLFCDGLSCWMLNDKCLVVSQYFVEPIGLKVILLRIEGLLSFLLSVLSPMMNESVMT